MQDKINFCSNVIFLFLNGKVESILTPWFICIDFQKETFTVKKKNWYLVGFIENVHSFRYIRKVEIKQHFFGADIEINSTGCNSKVFCLRKKEVEKIKNSLIAYNQHKKNRFIFF